MAALTLRRGAPGARRARPVRDPARARADAGAAARARRSAATVRGALVAGTNGKGSVLALAAAALRAAGLSRRRDAQAAPRHLPRADRRSTAGRSTRRRSPGSSARSCAAADRVARRHGEPTEFELLTAVVFRWFAEERRRPRARRGRARRAARCDPRLGRRRRRDHQRRPRPHGPARRRRSPAIAREKAAIIERGDLAVTGATRRRRSRSSGGARAGSACR